MSEHDAGTHDDRVGGWSSEPHPRQHIRSFAIRTARMSAYQRRCYEQLFKRYCIAPTRDPVQLRRHFPAELRAARLIVEIGFGMGDATLDFAREHPDTAVLGFEVHRPGIGKLLGGLEREKLDNVRVIPEDAMELLPSMLAGVDADGIHVFFPDPWPKKRHHKRRLIRPSFTPAIREALVIGGYLYAVTDWENYAEQMLEVLTATAGLRNRYDRFAPRQPWRPTTAFERKAVAAGRRIHELLFERVS